MPDSEHAIEHSGEDADVLIVGAGMAGLSAARVLQTAGKKVILLDKGRGFGGRLATRRLSGATLDHGAQFFTARSEAFKTAVALWEQDGAVSCWCRGFLAGDDSDRHPRFHSHGGMNKLAKFLSADLDVRRSQRVTKLTANENQWALITEQGLSLTGNALILTPPVPQSLQLLEDNDISLPPQQGLSLSRIVYHPCIAILLRLSSPSRIPPPGAIQHPEGTSGHITWLGDNQQKGISAEPAVTVHLNEHYSQSAWTSPDEQILTELNPHIATWVDPAHIVEAEVKRWRYSRPIEPLNIPFIATELPKSLVFAGDAFSGSRVEGAWLSGRKAAIHLA